MFKKTAQLARDGFPYQISQKLLVGFTDFGKFSPKKRIFLFCKILQEINNIWQDIKSILEDINDILKDINNILKNIINVLQNQEYFAGFQKRWATPPRSHWS